MAFTQKELIQYLYLNKLIDEQASDLTLVTGFTNGLINVS